MCYVNVALDGQGWASSRSILELGLENGTTGECHDPIRDQNANEEEVVEKIVGQVLSMR